MKWLFALAVLGLLVVATTSQPVRGLKTTVVLEDEKATITAYVKVNLTKVARVECDFYEKWASLWGNRILKEAFKDAIEDLIEKHLREIMGYEGVVVEDLSIDYSFSKEYGTYSVNPTALTLVNGTLVSGSVENLTAEDSSVVRVESLNASNTMYVAVDLNITLPEWVPIDKVEELTLTLTGNLSKTVNDKASIEVYNYENGVFEILDSTGLNSTESTTKTYTLASPENYVRNRVVVLRVEVVDKQTYPSTLVYLDLDHVSLGFKYFKVTVEVRFKLVLSGIANSTFTGRVYNVKFRALNPDKTIECRGYRFNPARLFFLNFRAFNVPLEEWARRFNGTHTIFSYTIRRLTLYTHGGVAVTVDPTEEIVVEGEAEAEGDTIVTKEITDKAVLGVGLAVAVVFLVIAVIALAPKLLKKTIIEAKTRRFKFIRREKEE